MSAPAQRRSALVKLFISLAFLAGAFYVFGNRQEILDRIIVWRYQPTSEIRAVAERSQLSDKGTFLFYASQPSLLARDAFNTACRSRATEQTAVLGCYSRNQIYLFDVDNETLDGIKEVTAAHEMLHAAYQRMSEKERTHIDTLLDQQDLGADKERIDVLMQAYATTEPGEQHNELHSIIGSEVATLSPELETYYARYFEDRTKLVALSEKYQSVFAALKSQQTNLVSSLTSLGDSIEQKSSVYKRNLQVLNADIENFNQRASSGAISRAEYDQQRITLESRQDSLRSDYTEIQRLLAQYEEKRAELASINSESDALNRSINSSVAPVPESL